MLLFQDDKVNAFLHAMKNQISVGISSNCNCSYSSSHISQLHILCSRYPKYISVRGSLTGTEDYTAHAILTFLDSWRLSSSTTIFTDNRILSINRNCSVSIESWNEVECQPPPRVQPCQCNCNKYFNNSATVTSP